MSIASVPSPSALSLAVERLCDLLFISFGAWSLLAPVFYFLGGSFHSLVVCALILCVASLIYAAFILLHTAERRLIDYRPTKEHVVLALFASLAVILTLCLNRPDADDRFYLGLSLLVLDYPDTPIRQIPVPRAFHTGYALTSHALLNSAVSYLTTIPILYVYYLIIPALLSVFVVLVHWRLLRLLICEQWLVGLAFFFIVMLSWGDAHRTHANFGFVRLFQGKAALVSLVVPALIFYFLKYHQTADRKYALLLFCALIAGIGFTPTGIVVGLLTLLALLAANVRRAAASARDLLVWSAILLLPAVAGLLIIYYFQHAGSPASVPLEVRQSDTNYDTLLFVLGPSLRGLFALACFAISPLCIENPVVKGVYTRFVIVCMILILLPWTSEVIGRLTYTTASWRWLWMIPFPAAMAIVVGRASAIRASFTRLPVGYLLVLAVSLGYVLCPNPLVLSAANGTTFTRPQFKLEDPHSIYLLYYDETAQIRDGYIYVEKSGKRF